MQCGEMELTFLLVVDVREGTCGAIPFNYKPHGQQVQQKRERMVEVAEHVMLKRLRAQLQPQLQFARGMAPLRQCEGGAQQQPQQRAVKVLWRATQSSVVEGGVALVYDNHNVVSEVSGAETLREIAHPHLPLVLRWHVAT